MNYKLYLAALLSFLTVAVLRTGVINAEPLSELTSIEIPTTTNLLLENFNQQNKVEAQKLKSVKYQVKRGDTLTKVAKDNHTTVQRLYDKNTKIVNPDRLFVGAKITVPSPEEKLKHRKIPHNSPASIPVDLSEIIPRTYVVSGNTYAYGYCTWYVKNRRPDLPNSLGNANTWYSRARALGLPVGTTPRAGAAGTTMAGALGHVVYVEKVVGNQVYISEMNYKGWNIRSTRIAPASEFYYIY